MTDFSNPLERIKLMRQLSGLPPALLSQVILALDPPAGIIPSTAAPGFQVSALLEWVPNPVGVDRFDPGFVLVPERARTTFPPNFATRSWQSLGQ